MTRPFRLDLSVARHLIGHTIVRTARRVGRFPLVTMLEPLEACNLACTGCGRVREYRGVIDRRLTVDESLAVLPRACSRASASMRSRGRPSMYSMA